MFFICAGQRLPHRDRAFDGINRAGTIWSRRSTGSTDNLGDAQPDAIGGGEVMRRTGEIPGHARFVADSPLEEGGFEPSVPLSKSPRKTARESGSVACSLVAVRFAEDSTLEEIGFELVVPWRAASRQGPTNCPAIIIAVDDRNYLQS
jgi:hypothetical protein